jgi:hypothetical protein
MLSHTDLDAGRMQSIHVVGTGKFGAEPARIKAVFVRFSQQPHGYPAFHGSDQSVTDADVRQPVHGQVDLLSLLIDLRNRAPAVILRKVLVRQKVDCRIDRMSWILAS